MVMSLTTCCASCVLELRTLMLYRGLSGQMRKERRDDFRLLRKPYQAYGVRAVPEWRNVPM